MFSLEIWDLDCFIEKVELEEVKKRECPRVTNHLWNSRGERLAVVKVAEQYVGELQRENRKFWVV